MSQLGIGAMISALSYDGSSADTFKAAIGKTITDLKIVDDALHISFEDGTGVRLYDDAQSCCESRYMRTDDDLAPYIGGKLVSGEILDGPTQQEDEWDVHEVQFLKITTSKGIFTVSSHNEHNGYYGGISCRVAAL